MSGKTSRQDHLQDIRFEIYRKFHGDALVYEERFNHAGAMAVLNILLDRFNPESILDVGCGIGTWLSVAESMGVADIFGIEGPWLDIDRLCIDPGAVTLLDLETPFDLKRRFDLVISLEVAEHLSEAAAEDFIASLIRHGDVILFSAAIPYQGGQYHLNEQWQPYWAALFKRHGYQSLGFLKESIWNNQDIFHHLRQNMLLFVPDPETGGNRHHQFDKETPTADLPLPLVHPQTHINNIHLMDQLMQIKHKYDAMMELLMKGGTFTAAPKGEADLVLKRVASSPETSKRLNAEGTASYESGDVEAAETTFQEAIELDPEYAETYNNLAVLYWQKGCPEKAFAYAEEALSRNPEDPDTVINFAIMCKEKGCFKKAREVLAIFIGRHPDVVEAKKLFETIPIIENDKNRYRGQ